MNILIYNGEHEQNFSMEFEASSLKEILSAVRFRFGEACLQQVLINKYRFILLNSKQPEESVAISEQMLLAEYKGFDTILILKDVNGDIAPGLVIAALWEIGLGAIALSSTAVYIITGIVNLALSFALSALMSLLAPTPEFDTDPAAAKTRKSSLFEGAPIIREQGGVVPIIMGEPYCGGVLISAGISSEDVPV